MKYLLLIHPIIWLLLSGLLNAYGEYFSKRWADQPNNVMLLAVGISYLASSIVWLPALLQYNKLSVIGTAWLLIATLSTIILGVFLFKEQLTPIQWTGVGLSTIALILLSWH